MPVIRRPSGRGPARRLHVPAASLALLALLLAAGLASCLPEGEGDSEDASASDDDTGDAGPQTLVGAVSRLWFARASEEGISSGFDLDGAITAEGDAATGCGIGDYVAPDGTPGIDNAFARLIPALELTEAQAVEGLIQDAIDSGELVLLFRIDDVDDAVEDESVDVTILRGVDDVLLSTEGHLEMGQTYAVDESTEPVVMSDVPITGGRLVASPFSVTLPIEILNASLEFHLLQGAFQVDIGADGTFAGVFGGAVDIAELVEVAFYENVDPDLGAVVEALLDLSADLAPDGDGVCRWISLNFEFSGVQGFLFD